MLCRPLTKEQREQYAAQKRAKLNQGTRKTYGTIWAVFEVSLSQGAGSHC